jgi:hypothetical protein
VNQRFTVNAMAKSQIVGGIKRLAQIQRQTLLHHFFSCQDMNINVLTVELRALLSEQAGMPFNHGEEYAVTLQRVFPGWQRVGGFVDNGL